MEKFCYGCMRPKQQSPKCEHCGFLDTTRNESHQLPMGTVLQNNYVVGRVLGQGGFGITYLGWDSNLEEPVAIKEYFPSGQVSRNVGSTRMVQCTAGISQFQDGRERFLREARTLAKLRSNPNIVQVMNFFSENNTAYIVMEYVKGITLQHYIQRRGGRLTVSETFTILQPIIKALAKVHQSGMIHRDISPDNIMLQEDGTVKLLDFGTARDVDTATGGQMTHSTQAVLKHGFAPMEQYSSGRGVDLRADEYALCSTVYYCLTGRVPPDAPQQVMDGVRPDWRNIPGLTASQIQALERGTALRAEDRYASLEELEIALFGPAPAAATYFPDHKPMPTMGGSPSLFPGTLPYSQSQSQSQTPVPPPVQPPAVSGIKKGAGPKALLPIAASFVAVVSLIACLVMLTGRKEPEPTLSFPEQTLSFSGDQSGILVQEEPVSTLPELEPLSPGSQQVIGAPKSWEDNVLMSDTTGTYPGPSKVFGSDYERTSIATVTFLSTLEGAPGNAWDVSAAQDGSVMAWTRPADELYDLYIAAEGGVRAPENCEYLFDHYENMTTLDFNGSFHVTSDVTNMHNMFGYCRKVQALDVSNFDTSNVTNMYGVFLFCDLVTELDLSGFDTSSVTNMNSMFFGCYGMLSLDLRSFDTSNVTNMSGMFSSCQAMTKVDVSSFDTSKVTDMGSMFSTCNSLTHLDVSNFDTSKVTDMSHMFPCLFDLVSLDLTNFDTSNVTNMNWMFAYTDEAEINLGKWETGKVEEYEHFMEDNILVNGKPWTSLF